ncbi:MAG: hypothetical protein Q9218_007489, partial [Villophora microphyllina]
MPTAVITGANSGIGHAFVKQLLNEDYDVFALDINIGPELKDLSCQTFRCDLSSPESIAQFATEYQSAKKPLDILLNIAGVMASKAADSLQNVDSATLHETFQANTFGPLLLTQQLLPSLLQAKDAKIAFMSSRVGSIADNSSGGAYSYRASKAALNSIGKSMAMDLKDQGITVLLLHPGFVISGLDKSGETEKNPQAVMPEEAAQKLWGVETLLNLLFSTMANPNYSRVTQNILDQGTLPPGHPLRTILSQQGIQNTLFGRDSAGGLDRDDYDSLQVLVGTVMAPISQARIMPLQCSRQDPNAFANSPPCNNVNGVDGLVMRCEGRRVDHPAFRGQRNLAFPRFDYGNNRQYNRMGIFPEVVKLDYQDKKTDYFKKWEHPPPWKVDHPFPKPMICGDCIIDNWNIVMADWYNEFHFDAPDENRRRWARLCRKHTMRLRQENPEEWQRGPMIDLTIMCDCLATIEYINGCMVCCRDTDHAWLDRAQHWRNELLNTHVPKPRGRKHPRVDFKKRARAQPACPFKNCGGRPWTSPPGKRTEADTLALSLCLACSGLKPKPPWHPIFGNLITMGKAAAAYPPNTHPHMYPHWLRKQFPELGSVFYIDVWPVAAPMLIILDPAVAAQVIVQHSLPKHYSTREYVYPLIGSKNLVTLEGKEWKRWRGMFNPGFASAHLMSLVGGMVADTVQFTKILSDYAAQGKVFQLEDAATRLTVDIIGDVTLDMPLQAQTTENKLVNAFRNQLNWMPIPNDLNLFRKYNPWKFVQHRMNTRIMNNYLDDLLEKRFAVRQQEEKARTNKRNKPIIDLALDAYLNETQQSEVSSLPAPFKRSAIDQFKTFLFAGHDTTSSTACYIVHLLAKHPEALQRLFQEHDEVYGTDIAKTAQAISDDPHSLNRLPYTLAVIKEVLRLYPPVSSVRVGEPNMYIEYDGQRYPTEDMMVWPIPYAMHRSPDLWIKPEEFIPERFLAKEGDPLFPTKGAWRPFEYGPRNCIGQELAYIELKIFMILTLREFDFKPAYDQQDKIDGKDRSTYTLEGDRAYQVLIATAKPALG